MPDHHTLFNIHGQTAIITGDSDILGSAMAHGLAQVGANVVVIGLHEAKISAVAEAISAQGAGRSPLPVMCLNALTCNAHSSK